MKVTKILLFSLIGVLAVSGILAILGTSLSNASGSVSISQSISVKESSSSSESSYTSISSSESTSSSVSSSLSEVESSSESSYSSSGNNESTTSSSSESIDIEQLKSQIVNQEFMFRSFNNFPSIGDGKTYHLANFEVGAYDSYGGHNDHIHTYSSITLGNAAPYGHVVMFDREIIWTSNQGWSFENGYDVETLFIRFNDSNFPSNCNIDSMLIDFLFNNSV